MNLSKIIIETERLLLVPISSEYSEQIFLEYNQSVTAYMNHGPSESMEDVEVRIKRREVEMEQGILLFMVVLLKDTNEFLGCFALEDLDQKIPEMGGWVKESAQGHRYGREVVNCGPIKI